MPDVYLITGAGSGFGALAARAIAKQGHIVYAGMHSADNDRHKPGAEAAKWAKENNADLRSVVLDLLSQNSCNNAVKEVLEGASKLDAVVHNAGHMNFGPCESFTAEQMLHLYDVNCIGTQRLNQAVLPYMRAQRRGHLIWISSSSVWGGKSSMLGAYFAAKAAMDAFAQTYARELNPWGIETTIILPGAFTKGTNHFANAMQPGVPEIAKEYEEGPTKGVGDQCLRGTADIAGDSDPIVVAEALIQLAAVPRGQKPYRMVADPAGDGCGEGAGVIDRNGINFIRRMGLERILTVTL